MKWAVVAAVLLVAAVAEGADLAHRQQAVNRLLYRIYSPIPSKFPELKQLSNSFNPRGNAGNCKDGGNAVNHLMDELDAGRLLEQHHWFSLFNTRQREEALMLVDVLLNCENFESFVGNAAFFRERMNEGEFVYAFYVAVSHSDFMQDVVLPPLYEVTPHMFTNSEVIDKAYTAKMTQTPGEFRMSFTGSKRNPEQRVAYFGEDVGMNSHHVHWHMDFPFWWHGDEIDRKGELFFWAHHQLTVRFDAERLSNYLPLVDELYWDRPIKEGFAPHTNYKYGGEFPTRPDNKNFEDVDGVARIRDMKEMESRIRDAIAHGYVDKSDGSHIDIDNDHGIDVLGAAIESSTSSVNPSYYGALHNQAHRVLGAQADPHGKFNMPPGVMEHFETATRDPSFFRLHKYMDNIFKEHKDKLPPYTADDLKYDNVEISDVDIDELSTFFEDFEFDLGNSLDTADNVKHVDVHAHIPRLNHKPFHYNIHYHADHDDTVSIRVYLTPVRDENGIKMHIDENRWHAIMIDNFWAEVKAGTHNIRRSSFDSSVTIQDRVSFEELISKADEAVENNHPLEVNSGRSCGHPHNLLLPKGNKEGVEFWLNVHVTSGDDAAHADLHSNWPPDRSGERRSRAQDSSSGVPTLRPLPISVTFDMRNVLAMTEIKTHIGYARAWVRLSLEKKVLSKHLTVLLGNSKLLQDLYKRYAFLRCEDEKEQFLSYLLSLNAVDYFCFTNTYTTTMVPYRVVIFPSRKLSGASTSSNAWVSLGGTLGQTSNIPVPRNQVELVFQHKNLGLLTTLRIGHDNTGMSPKWMVEHVLVRNEVTGHTWKFPCGRWLGRGIDDGSLERILVGELVPSHITSDDLVESCRTPVRCRSPNMPGPRRSDLKLTIPDIQQHLGDSVNNLVKYFYKPEKERGSLTLLLCGDFGLVCCLEQVFSYGFKSTRFFGKNLYLWDYFERVQQHFEVLLREEAEREQLTGIARDGRDHGLNSMAELVGLVSRINASSSHLGKDDKFQLFVCLAARARLLPRILLPLQRSPVTSHMYDESSFLRDPQLVRDLINVLSALNDFEIVLESSLTRGID